MADNSMLNQTNDDNSIMVMRMDQSQMQDSIMLDQSMTDV